jgi:cobalt/nickel transport system permease protein
MLSHDLTGAWVHLDTPIHRLDARVKLVSSGALLAAVLAVPVAHSGLMAVHAAGLVVLVLLARLPLRWVLKRMAILAPFLVIGTIGVAFLPPIEAADAWQLGGLELSSQAMSVWLSIGGKCVLSLLLSILLVATASPGDLISALSALRVPRTVTALLGFAVAYIHVLADEAGRMVTAMRSRGTPRGLRRRASTAVAMLTTLMVRTVQRAERVALAMVSRGYRGSMPSMQSRPVPRRQWAVAGTVVLAAAGLTLVGVML